MEKNCLDYSERPGRVLTEKQKNQKLIPMKIIDINYKKVSNGVSQSIILSVEGNRRIMTELMIPVIGIIGLILQNLLK